MDKMKNEFETQALNMGHSVLKIDGQYIESLTVILHTGYLMGQQSRDEEIKELKEAVREENEACAMECDNLSIKHWDMYKGRGTAKPNNIGRADPHYQGLSDGEELCSEKIRARNK